jgi:hypothetical protein
MIEDRRAPRVDHETPRITCHWVGPRSYRLDLARQKEPSLSEQDRAQIVAGREGTTKGSSALKPIDQAALQAAVDATAEELLVPGALVILSTPASGLRPGLTI